MSKLSNMPKDLN